MKWLSIALLLASSNASAEKRVASRADQTFEEVARGSLRLSAYLRLAERAVTSCQCQNEFQTAECAHQRTEAMKQLRTVRRVRSDEQSEPDLTLKPYDFARKTFDVVHALRTQSRLPSTCPEVIEGNASGGGPRTWIVVAAKAPRVDRLRIEDLQVARFLREHSEHLHSEMVLAVDSLFVGMARDEEFERARKAELATYKMALSRVQRGSYAAQKLRAGIAMMSKVSAPVLQMRVSASVIGSRFWFEPAEPDPYAEQPSIQKEYESVANSLSGSFLLSAPPSTTDPMVLSTQRDAARHCFSEYFPDNVGQVCLTAVRGLVQAGATELEIKPYLTRACLEEPSADECPKPALSKASPSSDEVDAEADGQQAAPADAEDGDDAGVAPESSGTGTINVYCVPVANILIDGKETGQRTGLRPVPVVVSAGKHKVSCRGDTGKLSREQSFNVTDGAALVYRQAVPQ